MSLWRNGGVRSSDSLPISLVKGKAERVTMIISSISTGEPLERFLFDMSYMDLGKFRSESDKSVG